MSQSMPSELTIATTASAAPSAGAQTFADTIINAGHIIRAVDANNAQLKTDITRMLQALYEQYSAATDPDQKKLAKESIAEYLQEAIARVDDELGQKMDEILHDAELQKLEARWRGLHYLVMNTETSTRLKIRVLNSSIQELKDDLGKAPDFDRSLLFKKVYEEEYGTFGGAPFSMLTCDHYFTSSATDVDFLRQVSNVAAAAHAPFVSASDPDLFDLDKWTSLGQPGDLAKIFESSRLIKYREFRDTEDSRYVTLTLPRVLFRSPYSTTDNPITKFVYDENVFVWVGDQKNPDGSSVKQNGRTLKDRIGQVHENFLFGNAAYAMTQRITNAFALYGWTAAIRGVEGGGLVENLPVHLFKTSDGDTEVKCPTEVAITDRRENELSELGFIALCYKKQSGQAAFFGASTANKPKAYFDPKAQSNARLSAALPYILASSRFAHYLKVIMRDKIGSFASRQDVEGYLNNWIGNYVLLSDGAGQETKARFPLREARVDVTEVPGKPGAYKAVAFLRPHFQLNELTISLRLVAELPPPAA